MVSDSTRKAEEAVLIDKSTLSRDNLLLFEEKKKKKECKYVRKKEWKDPRRRAVVISRRRDDLPISSQSPLYLEKGNWEGREGIHSFVNNK